MGAIDVLWDGIVLCKELRQYVKVTLDTVQVSKYMPTCTIVLLGFILGLYYMSVLLF